MADFSEKWGTDVDTAVKLALDDLKLTIDDVDVTVLEEPSRGFFGIGSKLALVRVEKKKTTDIETVKVEKELNKDKKDFDNTGRIFFTKKKGGLVVYTSTLRNTEQPASKELIENIKMLDLQ